MKRKSLKPFTFHLSSVYRCVCHFWVRLSCSAAQHSQDRLIFRTVQNVNASSAHGSVEHVFVPWTKFLQHAKCGHLTGTVWIWEVVPKRNTHFLSWAPYLLPCKNYVKFLGKLGKCLEHSELKNDQGILPTVVQWSLGKGITTFFCCKLQSY